MAGEKGETGSENAVGWAWLAVVFAALLFLIWWYFEYDIKNVVRWIRYYEAYLLTFILPDSYTVTWDGKPVNFQAWMAAVPDIPTYCSQARSPNAPGGCMNNDTIGVISTLAMEPLSYLFSAIIVGLGIYAVFEGPESHYRGKLTLDMLIKRQSTNFPVIQPFVKFNPSKLPVRPPGAPVPAELPPFSEALGPEEWLAYYSIPVPDGKVDEDAAKRAFIKQLGPPWRGPSRLPPYLQVLLAGFCLKAARKRDESDEMLGRLATCWSFDKGLIMDPKLLKDARKVLGNRDLVGATLAKCNQHAFQTTAIMRALLTAREEGGVLAPSTFVWLRAYDRALWYPLHNLGRQSYLMEALGAMAQFKLEKRTQRPIPRPKVDDAVQSISEYMASSLARPIPALDYSASKEQRGVKKVKGSK